MSVRVRNVVFILCGVAVLVLKSSYAGPYPELVHSYLGNFSVSFAVYFLCVNAVLLADPLLRLSGSQRRSAAAVLAFAVVALFEETNGFGVMSNTYDPLDHLANAAGIAFAVLADAATAKFIQNVEPVGRRAG